GGVPTSAHRSDRTTVRSSLVSSARAVAGDGVAHLCGVGEHAWILHQVDGAVRGDHVGSGHGRWQVECLGDLSAGLDTVVHHRKLHVELGEHAQPTQHVAVDLYGQHVDGALATRIFL